MVIEGMSVFPMCLKVSLKVPLLPPWYQVISCTWEVSECSECFSRYVLKCRCFPNGISRYPMYIEGISRYISRLLLKVSFKVFLKVALKVRHNV